MLCVAVRVSLWRHCSDVTQQKWGFRALLPASSAAGTSCDGFWVVWMGLNVFGGIELVELDVRPFNIG